jgi:hypothetical protein
MAGGLWSMGGTLASLFEIVLVGKQAHDEGWRHSGVNMDE